MFGSHMIKKRLKEKISEGMDRFVIYPFGDNGLLVKTILYEYFGLGPLYVADNEFTKYNPNIISLGELREKFDDSMCIILTVEDSELNMRMQDELLAFADGDHILNFKAMEQALGVEKQRTLMESMLGAAGDFEEKARKLLYADCKHREVVRIYSAAELKDIDSLCFDFVKEQLRSEAVEASAVKDAENSILFFAPLFESFWTNVLPLFRKYAQKGHKCVVMFGKLVNFWWTRENLNRIKYVMREIQNEGGQCILYDDCTDWKAKFRTCFFCSEYSLDTSPGILRAFADRLVAVQTTGIYKHVYKSQIPMEKLYDELTDIDYYVGSDYICQWFDRNNDAFRDKMLRVGYPKMDTLYGNLNRAGLPAEWSERIGGRKVILLTIENPELYVDIFAKFPELCFIWRPDPEFMGTKSCMDKIDKLKSRIGCLLIDENRTYGNAFNASTAMIGMAIFCVPVNYIFTGKPLLLLDGKLNMYYHCMAMEYREEAWYKACYIAEEEREIEAFIRMICRGEDELAQEQRPYKDRMNRNFDGNVCERVYQALECKR